MAIVLAHIPSLLKHYSISHGHATTRPLTAAYSCMRSVDAEIVGSGGESEQASQQSEELGGLAADSDWHALTQKEEADLDTIMSQCEFAISNAEKFADQLSRDLSVLDGVCACAICVCFERDMYFLFCKCSPT